MTLRQNPWIHYFCESIHTHTALNNQTAHTHCNSLYCLQSQAHCHSDQVASAAGVPVSTGPRVPTPETPERGHTGSCHTVANHRHTHRNRGTLIHTRPLFRAGIVHGSPYAIYSRLGFFKGKSTRPRPKTGHKGHSAVEKYRCTQEDSR